jgi:hypothetical protein
MSELPAAHGEERAIRPLPSRRASLLALVFAAGLTVAVAIGFDLLAGEHPVHVLTLGLVAVALGVARLRLRGRHDGFLAAASGALVAQPALQTAMKLLPAAPDAPGHLAQGSVSALQILVAVGTVTVVTGARRLFLLVVAVGAVGRRLRLLVAAPALPHPAPIRRRHRAAPLRNPFLSVAPPRRGPPPRPAAAG